MARLYSNENFPLPVVEALRRLGHDVLTIQETGKGEQNISDEAVLTFARADARLLLTLNRKHFIRLHTEHPNHSGMIVCTFDLDFIGQAQRIHAAIDSSGDFSGFRISVLTQKDGDVDTLGTAVTGRDGGFSMTVRAPEKGIYPILVERETICEIH